MDEQTHLTELGHRPLILASVSPRRFDLLARSGVPCRVVPSHADELVYREAGEVTPAQLCVANARRKAEEVARGVREACLVLAADTIVVLGRSVLGKPADAEEARRMLRRLSGRTHEVLTGCAIVETLSGRTEAFVVATRVTCKPLTEDEIAGYVATGEPMDKAGAYGIQGRGACLVAGIHGSYTNVVGLPLAETLDALARLGGPRAFSAPGPGQVAPT